jgi:flagellar biosynthetic protein FliO
MSIRGSPAIIFDVACGVVRLKKKLIVFLITVALGGGVLVVCSAGSSTDATGLEKPKFDPCQPQAGTESETDSLFQKDPNFLGGSPYNAGSGQLFFRAMLAVLFVVVLGVAAIYVSRKLLPKIANLPGKEIRIIETVHLGPRKAVHLLEIGNRRLLIGSTNENVTKLADITGSFANLSAQEIEV